MTQELELRVEPAVSAGGVVFRRDGDRIEVVLCGRTREALWALPKGTPEPGESLRDTAIREVEEETGLGVAIVAELGVIQYAFARPSIGVRFDKTVHHFLMEPTGSGALDRHDGEYDVARWFDIDEAIRAITHQNEADVLSRALGALSSPDASR